MCANRALRRSRLKVLAAEEAATVSIVVASHDRPALLEIAVACASRQQSARVLEVVVVDDSSLPIPDWIRDTCDVVQVPRSTPLGDKLNIGISRTTGSILMKWDDDDFYGPRYVDHLARALSVTNAQVVFAQPFLVFDANSRRLHLTDETRCSGATLTFRRTLWEQVPFRAVEEATDSEFLLDVIDRHGLGACRGVDLGENFVQLRHGTHLWTRMPDGRPVEEYVAECVRVAKPVEDIVGTRVQETWLGLGTGDLR